MFTGFSATTHVTLGEGLIIFFFSQLGRGIFSNKTLSDSHIYILFSLLTQLLELEITIILLLCAGKMYSLKLRKSECRTSLLMTFGPCSLVTGQGDLGRGNHIAQVSAVRQGAALCGVLLCGQPCVNSEYYCRIEGANGRGKGNN